MESKDFTVILFVVWALGITVSNIYLSRLFNQNISTRGYLLHFVSDILVAATAGLITYLLASTLGISNFVIAMIAAVMGHMAARVVYKTLLMEKATKVVDEPIAESLE